MINNKNITLSNLRTKLENSNKNQMVIFYADWCPYCQSNVPFIKSTLEKNNFDEALFVNISDEKLDVWAEDGNTEWAIELVPTVRVYNNKKFIFDHKNVIDENKLNEAIKLCK